MGGPYEKRTWSIHGDLSICFNPRGFKSKKTPGFVGHRQIKERQEEATLRATRLFVVRIIMSCHPLQTVAQKCIMFKKRHTSQYLPHR
mmetsp:Transcript_41359/g.99053  ORF Transcript_41359/g.99053 Transcript_41359/m.99053 type:complete len:88 (+) Transcript_41359:176-439(+)